MDNKIVISRDHASGVITTTIRHTDKNFSIEVNLEELTTRLPLICTRKKVLSILDAIVAEMRAASIHAP